MKNTFFFSGHYFKLGKLHFMKYPCFLVFLICLINISIARSQVTTKVKSQLPVRPLTESKTDTVFIAVNNDFIIDPDLKIKQYDKNITGAWIKNNKLTIIPHNSGLFQVELSGKDSSKIIRKSFYAMRLPAPK